MKSQKLYEIWGRRNPRFETHFEDRLLRLFTEYGGGSVESMSSKGKIFGAGYELYIYAFFVGLYANERMGLSEKLKTLGQPIQFWGNLESKKFRRAYPKLREYIFTALVAKTDNLNWIDVEKGKISERKAVDYLIYTMEEYANYGFHKIMDKIDINSNHFFKNTSFLYLIIELVQDSPNIEDSETIEDL